MAIQYHTARFRLVPSLVKALNVPVPPVRKPGTAWVELLGAFSSSTPSLQRCPHTSRRRLG
ncbi:hypothetical protein ACFYSH_33370 [Streptomyces sp. NPDC005791]|uniref:hypothetical protein n=1 Tax=Streptomyces sp. NPDC005791 TaxID=3364732 RepID=UPI0036C67DB8